MAVIVAPGTVLPLGSRTVPPMLPADWARAGKAERAERRAKDDTHTRDFNMMPPRRVRLAETKKLRFRDGSSCIFIRPRVSFVKADTEGADAHTQVRERVARREGQPRGWREAGHCRGGGRGVWSRPGRSPSPSRRVAGSGHYRRSRRLLPCPRGSRQ